MDSSRLSGITQYNIIKSLFFLLPILSIFFSYGFAYIFNLTFAKQHVLIGSNSTLMSPVVLFIISIIFALLLGQVGYILVCLYNKNCLDRDHSRSLAYYLYIVFLLFLWPIVFIGLSSPLAALIIAVIMLLIILLALPTLVDVNFGAFLLGLLFALYVIILIITSSDKCLKI